MAACRGFYAYPSNPQLVADAVTTAIERVNAAIPSVEIQGWEKCRVGGKVIIDEICKSIDDSVLFCADLTGLNPNVMFELGYAMARDKRIWLSIDNSFENGTQALNQVKLLTVIGQARHTNGELLAGALMQEAPWTDSSETIFRQKMQAHVAIHQEQGLLYLRHRHETEAASRVTSQVGALSRRVRVVEHDPNESSVRQLEWFARETSSASAVLVLLCEPTREGWEVHNARYAFVAGMAYGFGRNVLMLAESSYFAPLDYRDLLCTYSSSSECEQQAETFIAGVEAAHSAKRDVAREARAHESRQRTALSRLYLGDHVAENEQMRLSDYFVETTAYREALAGRHSIFLGRKGTGKTATLYRMQNELSGDKRNIVAVIKPEGYELDGLLRLLRTCKEMDAKGYLVQSLWKYLIYSEVACAVAAEIRRRPAGVTPGSPSASLVSLVESKEWTAGDFASRLERAVTALLTVDPNGAMAQVRVAVSEQLHQRELGEVRELLGAALGRRERVAVLIDNLDKNWKLSQAPALLAELLLGLLSAVEGIRDDLARAISAERAVQVAVTVFLRSDIFRRVAREAGERDKLSRSAIVWSDPELLLRVIEERYSAVTDEATPGNAVWSEVFTPEIAGMAVTDYILERTLPRPRDIVFFCNAAIAIAVNRRHLRVSEADVREAAVQYSQFAFEMLQAEHSGGAPGLEPVLYEFAGSAEVLAKQELATLLSRADIPHTEHDDVVRDLCGLSFLGVEVDRGQFKFVQDDEDLKKAMVLARKYAEVTGTARYQINPPFHAFLDIVPAKH